MISPDLSEALVRAAAAPDLLVCSDFDGTLSPIVPVPADARPLQGVVATLTTLAALPHTTVALLSGRALSELRVLAGVPDSVTLVGSHGAEFSLGRAESLTSPQRELLADLDRTLTAIADPVPGVRLERKPLSIAVHVRQAERGAAAEVLSAVRSGPARWRGIHVTTGKEVVELAVVAVDKGVAVKRLRARAPDQVVVVFLGDDVTDERAFTVLRSGDVGIKVGPGDTEAGYRVADPSAGLESLELILAERS